MATPKKIYKKNTIKKVTAISFLKSIAKKSPQAEARQAAKDKRKRREYLRSLNDQKEELELAKSIASLKKK